MLTAAFLAVVGIGVWPWGVNNLIALVISGVLFSAAGKIYRRVGTPLWLERLWRWRRSITVSLVAVATVAGLTWQWLRWGHAKETERGRFIVEIENVFDEPGAEWIHGEKIASPRWSNVLLLTWLWGQSHGQHFRLNLPLGDPQNDDGRRENEARIARAHWLFPEATLRARWRKVGAIVDISTGDAK